MADLLRALGGLIWYLALRAPLLVLALFPLALSILHRWSPGYWLWAVWMIPMLRFWWWLDESPGWQRLNEWYARWENSQYEHSLRRAKRRLERKRRRYPPR